jgi:two-component system, NtrC family, sensor kinase
MSEDSKPPPRLIARELAAGFGVVSLVSVAVFVTLLSLIHQVSGLVMGMREEEVAIRQGLELATAVREQYIHIARSLIEGDRRHLAHYATWRQRVQAGLEQLASQVPESERWRLAALEGKTRELADGFAQATVSAIAADRGADRGRLVADHQALARIADQASELADALAHVVASRMAHSHVLATRATQIGLIGGGIGALTVVALSIGFTLRLRRAVVQPLTALTAATRRYGAGEFTVRAGAIGRGELRALAQAFDRMAEELAERQRRLVHNERMAAIGHLAAGVAHELNNPIGIIRGYLKTMDARDAPETLADELQILDEEAAQCQRIAEDLLSYARPLELNIETIEMKAFVEETFKRFRESPGAKESTLKVDVDDFVLSADPARLRQVLLNLALNAVQLSPPGACVTVTGRVHPNEYALEVTDLGPGIAIEDHDRIFEPFFSKRKGGSGLGLSVCAGIIGAHGGSITVSSSVGQGATFRVALPRSAAPPGEGGA